MIYFDTCGPKGMHTEWGLLTLEQWLCDILQSFLKPLVVITYEGQEWKLYTTFVAQSVS